jgi:speckle-type POZ protein
VSDIGQHFNNLLQNKVGADATFEVGGETFDAHRCVLAARSPVFMAQLFGPMKEGTTSTVIQIKDMDAKVFRTLLTFIYTGSFFNMKGDKTQVAEEGEDEEDEDEFEMWLQGLLVAADIYDIQRLKRLCEEELSHEICVSSVASILTLAEQHNCPGLKEACLKFIQVQSLKKS